MACVQSYELVITTLFLFISKKIEKELCHIFYAIILLSYNGKKYLNNSLHPEHIIQAYQQGANLHYTKPTSFTDIIKGLEQLLSLDWTNPYSITEAYLQDGKYVTLK